MQLRPADACTFGVGGFTLSASLSLGTLEIPLMALWFVKISSIFVFLTSSRHDCVVTFPVYVGNTICGCQERPVGASKQGGLGEGTLVQVMTSEHE